MFLLLLLLLVIKVSIIPTPEMLKTKRKYDRTEPRVLMYLLDKKASKWEMKKALGKSYTNIHQTVKQLIDNRLLVVSYRKKSAKNQKIKVEYYDLTVKGLASAMSILELRAYKSKKAFDEMFERMDKIANNHRNKTIIFEEWNSFTNIEKKEIVKFFVDHKVFTLLRMAYTGIVVPKEYVKRSIDELCLGGFGSEFCPERLLKIFRKNPRLKSHTLNMLFKKLSFLEGYVESINRQIAKLESNKN